MEMMFFQSVVSLRCSSESLVECVLEQRQIQDKFSTWKDQALFIFSLLFLSLFSFFQ